MSVLGIAFGLSSDRVQGAARMIHVVLVPLAVIVLALLWWAGRQRRQRRDARPVDVD
jgi:membrane protein DedA with SNARE-associated domain